jgi:hypothetical protein
MTSSWAGWFRLLRRLILRPELLPETGKEDIRAGDEVASTGKVGSWVRHYPGLTKTEGTKLKWQKVNDCWLEKQKFAYRSLKNKLEKNKVYLLPTTELEKPNFKVIRIDKLAQKSFSTNSNLNWS